MENLEKKLGENTVNKTINLNSKAKKTERNRAIPNILNQQSKAKVNGFWLLI